MSGLKSLQEFTDSLVPLAQNFVDSDSGKVVGKVYPLRDTIVSMIKDILKAYYEYFPEEVPNELWLHAGLLGDGFSGEVQRMGSDQDLQTSSRYILGVKVPRIMGNPPESQRQKEIFVECSQAYNTLRPIGLFGLKENTNNLKKYGPGL